MTSPDEDSRLANAATGTSKPVVVSRWSWSSFFIGAIVSGMITAVLLQPQISSRQSSRPQNAVPENTRPSLSPNVSPVDRAETQMLGGGLSVNPSSMDEVLQLAERSLQQMRQTLDDYTATLVKQETINGVLTEPTEMQIKVQCVHRGGKVDDSEPMRVYLKFVRPDNVAGREVIWAEDLHDGQMIVHEVGLMGMVPIRLDPTGFIAMRGQRYPISEIGITKLVKKLIERGELDRHNPDVQVSVTKGYVLNGVACDLINVKRTKPTGRPDDFSRAEICFDSQRLLPLRYTAYGWADDGAEAPLIESYAYTNIQTNVGLSETDFDPKNPAYQFP